MIKKMNSNNSKEFEGLASFMEKNLKKAIYQTWQKNDRFTDTEIEFFYGLGYIFWESKEYVKALDVFLAVLGHRPNNCKYIKSVARCYFDLKEYIHSMSMYAYGMLCGDSEIISLFSIGQCHIHRGDLETASSMFQCVAMSKSNKQEEINIIQQANNLMNFLKKKEDIMNKKPQSLSGKENIRNDEHDHKNMKPAPSDVRSAGINAKTAHSAHSADKQHTQQNNQQHATAASHGASAINASREAAKKQTNR